jgi:hypothetical protein
VLSLVNVINNKAKKARHLLLHVARETFWFKGSLQRLSVAVCKSCTLHKDNALLCFVVKGVNVLLRKTTRFNLSHKTSGLSSCLTKRQSKIVSFPQSLSTFPLLCLTKHYCLINCVHVHKETQPSKLKLLFKERTTSNVSCFHASVE